MEATRLMPAQRYPTLIELEHSDWRSEFPDKSRQWICKQIESLLAKIFTNSFVLAKIPAIANEFEVQIFEDMAKSEVDYLRKIIFKLFCVIGDLEPICLLKDDQTASSSSSQSETNPDVTNRDVTNKNFIQDVPYPMSENSIICTGNHNQGLDWKEETFQEINYLVGTYGKMFCDIHRCVMEGPEKKGRSLVKMDRIEGWKDELDSILNILVTGKESVSIELKEKIPFIEKRILYYLNMKELFDCSQEIFSKLDTSSPDQNQTFMLDEFIKAFLMEKAKKLGVYIHLVEDDQAGYTIIHSLPREIAEIINEWCDHKIRILTRAQPTMEEIEKELSIWQTPGSKLQQWCLLKHLPMKVGPVQQHPDLLFEEVRNVWKLYDNIELQQARLFQQHQQQRMNPARKPTSPVPRQVDPRTKGLDATQQKARSFQQMDPALQQLPQYLGFSKQAGPQFGPVSEQPQPLPLQMGPPLRQLHKYHCSTLQPTERVLFQYLFFVPKKPVPIRKQQYTVASPTHLSHFVGPRSMPATT